MGRGERQTNKKEEEAKKADLQKTIEMGKALRVLVSVPEYAVLKGVQIECEQILLEKLKQTILTVNAQREPIYVPEKEIVLRQRVYVEACKWNNVVDNLIEAGIKAEKELTDILEKEKEEIEEIERPSKELHEFNKS